MIDTKNFVISKLKEKIKEIDIEEYGEYIESLKQDDRKAAQKLALSLEKKLKAYNMEVQRIKNVKEYENYLYSKGYEFIAGIDEVGRGPLAGPVVTAAVIMPKDSEILYVNDSKSLTKQKREELFFRIKQEAVAYSYGVIDNNEIDRINILNATKKAMLNAIDSLNVKPDVILIDAVHLDTNIKQKAFIKGDENVYCISAASIMAKVYRDNMMDEYAKIYPYYGFEKNKGYGTLEHVEAIRKYGLCDIHRKSFTENIVVNTVRKGKDYENVVKNYLLKHDYKIIETNYKCKYGEIDIIAKRGNMLCFVEVKGRSKDIIPPANYVDEDKQKKIAQSAKNYLKENNLQCGVRFDVVEITDKSRATFDIRFIKDAFRAKNDI